MKQKHIFPAVLRSIYVIVLLILSLIAHAQQQVLINMAPIDGMALTPTNIFGYTVQASGSSAVQVKGTLRYRNSGLSFSYSFNYQLQAGNNIIDKGLINPQWQFSSSSLRDLFFTYNTLPEGTYEYCVTVIPSSALPETQVTSFDECLFHRADGIFLINLIDPPNNAKLQEFNPALSWVANYTFVNELNYRIRVAEVKQGQNAVNAVMRNQPLYDEKNLVQNNIVYPVYAKPLEKNKYYAWTVDAYFRDILLGGAETWQFIIPEDTIKTTYPAMRSYIDIKRETGIGQIYILGELKLKYLLDKTKKDILTLQLLDDGNQAITLKPASLTAAYGDNRYELNLKEECNLKHLGSYKLVVTSQTGEQYTLPFKYLNPEYTH